jgi:hypothetical protein
MYELKTIMVGGSILILQTGTKTILKKKGIKK